jgi:hypothetical protein
MSNCKLIEYDKNHYSWSKEFRHQCEVRFVLKLRLTGRQPMLDYLEEVKKWRKTEPLEKDAREQWNKNNRGNEGDWR